MIKWLFFDIGSTLVDETACVEYRIKKLLEQPNAPEREVLLAKMQEITENGGNAYREAVHFFHLQTSPWPCDLETLYEDAPHVLTQLHKAYKLGVIANQVAGLEERLKAFGILQDFDVIASSAELGIAKPDPEIFLYALNKAGCLPPEAVMIGDRLDNDIQPASAMGMQTVWLSKGTHNSSVPTHTVASLTELLDLFL